MPGEKARADILSRALASIPLMPGKSRLASALARMAVCGGTRWGTCSLVNGVTLCVDLNDRIERLMWGHCFEQHVQRCLRALLSAGDVFIDIGAHIGYHALWGASLVGPSGKVFAFEADPANFLRLREHLRSFYWCTAVDKAVWNVTGTAVFERSCEPRESGWGTLAAVRDLRRGEHVAVGTISLDDWSSENRIDKACTIKIDAEGSEVRILRGAKNFLGRIRPAIIAEFNEVVLRQAGTSSEELERVLCELDYQLFSLSGTWLRPLRSTGNPQCSEVLALQADRQEDAMRRLRKCGFRI